MNCCMPVDEHQSSYNCQSSERRENSQVKYVNKLGDAVKWAGSLGCINMLAGASGDWAVQGAHGILTVRT